VTKGGHTKTIFEFSLKHDFDSVQPKITSLIFTSQLQKGLMLLDKLLVVTVRITAAARFLRGDG